MVKNERGGADSLLLTMFVVPLLLFISFAGVPFFVYIMKANHLNVVANHALKEAEALGYVSPAVAAAAANRLSGLGLGAVTVGGVTYPSFEGSTVSKVYRDSADPTIRLVVKYPAPNITRMLGALGFGGGSGENEGFYRIVLYGKSEAYE
ncbi:hypothetical protein [Paenibacillus alkalitolerans]|uniref:hypothetical protein n=1 Tax=Paenibacillus alkalitolerans TaxID=2799335 RepID=UPI001F1FA372|nr:hypothetical protein [Paenibacillus alkalitolerans]